MKPVVRPLLTGLLVLTMAISAAAVVQAAPKKSSYNRTDASFASMMLPHHEGGVELGAAAAMKGRNSDVRRLGKNIATTQRKEAGTLRALVRSFRTRVATTPEGRRREQLDTDKLKAATGTDFDRAWLDVISAHHMGAIQMAQMEVRGGRNAAARALARRIVETQRSELAQFNRLTAELAY